MSQPRIAAVLIVKNEGENLRACLQSVAGWVDEIVILDSGSSDNTAEIAAIERQPFIMNYCMFWTASNVLLQIRQK